MSKPSQPELKKARTRYFLEADREPDEQGFAQFMDKKLFVHIQGGRKVSGTLRGFDIFLNLVLDDAQDESVPAQKAPLGTVVIRGNSVTSMETLEAIR